MLLSNHDKSHLSRQYNCWSLRCSWSIACRRCSNYIFIIYLTLGFNGLAKDNCKTRWETFEFWNLVRLILQDFKVYSSFSHHCDIYVTMDTHLKTTKDFSLQNRLTHSVLYCTNDIWSQVTYILDYLNPRRKRRRDFLIIRICCQHQ